MNVVFSARVKNIYLLPCNTGKYEMMFEFKRTAPLIDYPNCFSFAYSNSCFCGNSYGRYGKSSRCNYKCEESNEICGGSAANSVYMANYIPLNNTICNLTRNFCLNSAYDLSLFGSLNLSSLINKHTFDFYNGNEFDQSEYSLS
jgi:hypothetical protein